MFSVLMTSVAKLVRFLQVRFFFDGSDFCTSSGKKYSFNHVLQFFFKYLFFNLPLINVGTNKANGVQIYVSFTRSFASVCL